MRCRHDATAGTCGHLFDRFDHLWTFADQVDVEPTNNAAAPRGYPALRHAVIWRKLSFGTQSAAGSRFVERMLSVIETCRQQGRSVLQFVSWCRRSLLHRPPAADTARRGMNGYQQACRLPFFRR
jgi:transposase